MAIQGLKSKSAMQGSEVNATMMAQLRNPVDWMGKAVCANDESVWRQAREGFREAPVELSESDCDLDRNIFNGMESWCHLFARKFAGDCAEPLVQIFASEPSNNLAIYIL